MAGGADRPEDANKDTEAGALDMVEEAISTLVTEDGLSDTAKVGVLITIAAPVSMPATVLSWVGSAVRGGLRYVRGLPVGLVAVGAAAAIASIEETRLCTSDAI